MEMEIKLSVIIPCLNAEATLPAQLTALAAEKEPGPWELIVADNGSTDRSIAVARSYKDSFQFFNIVDASDRRGAAHARNVGVSVARSDHIAFCDADDEVAPGWVARMSAGLSSHEVVYGRFRFEKFNDPHAAQRANKLWEDGLFKGRFLPGGGSGNLGVRRMVHEAIGGFDESLPRSEDADYYWRLQLEGFDLHFIPDAVVQVRRERVNPSLHDRFRRRRDTVASNYWSYKRYRHLGMLPPPSLKTSLSVWLGLIKSLVRLRINTRQKRRAWVKQWVEQTGELVGQLQGRLLNPCQPYYPGNKALKTKMGSNAPFMSNQRAG
ncbi:glycosyltransferase family A protein [uncultured Desulfosarcina sp.]|uniref:glycosyltransferase n=1 Tax=uncultured Desulfosarcina sp. TaxID=218289 RepID=UPI0029C81CAC|nr:glycosyltransferase family A protein [uncultured Desulfosarcina sp.]